jgi:hypothetical protein
VSTAVWELFEEAVTLVGPVPVLLEWESRVPSLDRVLDEVDRARAIQSAALDQRRSASAAGPHRAMNVGGSP